MIDYKGYTGVFEFDADLATFTGHVIDLRDQIYFEGSSVMELKESMRRAVDHYLEVCEARGEEPDRPYSGNFLLRLGPDLHRAATTAAASRSMSLNSWLVEVVGAALEKGPSLSGQGSGRGPGRSDRRVEPSPSA